MKISLCAPPRCNCPEIETRLEACGKTIVIIRDDFNNSCVMDDKDFTELAQKWLDKINNPDIETVLSRGYF